MRFLNEGNRIPTALIGLTVIVAFILGAFFVDELPKTGSGKVKRNLLKKNYSGSV